MHSFEDNNILEVVSVPYIMFKDPLFWLRKKVRPTIDLATVRKGLSVSQGLEEEGEAPPTPTQKRKQRNCFGF